MHGTTNSKWDYRPVLYLIGCVRFESGDLLLGVLDDFLLEYGASSLDNRIRLCTERDYRLYHCENSQICMLLLIFPRSYPRFLASNVSELLVLERKFLFNPESHFILIILFVVQWMKLKKTMLVNKWRKGVYICCPMTFFLVDLFFKRNLIVTVRLFEATVACFKTG
jgi:hypothetical protein